MKFLVDANVLSEPTKRAPNEGVLAWLRAHEVEIAMNPLIIGELRYGILCLPAGKKRKLLEQWFEGGVGRLVCLPWDSETGLRWAELLARLRREGRGMPVKDSMIAATALVHSLAVVTRNTLDFANTGVEIVNPFSG